MGDAIRTLYSEFILRDRASGQISALNAKLDHLEGSSDGAAAATEQVGDASGAATEDIRNQTEATEDASKKTSDLRNALLAVGAALTATGAAGYLYFTAISKSFATYESTRQAFTNALGADSTKMLADLTAATKGAVTQSDLILAANRALALGIDQSAIPRLAEIAEAASRVMGTDMSDAFDDITTGVGRQSRMILDNLGIIVNETEAYDAYAASLGKTASALSETERRAAFLNAVMENGQALIDMAGDSEDSLALSIKKSASAIEAMNLAMGQASSGPMMAWYNLIANIATRVANLPEPLLSLIAVIGMAGTTVSGITGPLMLQAAAVMFLRQQWLTLKASMLTTPATAAVATGSIATVTAALGAMAAAAWAALVPLLPFIAIAAAIAGIAAAIDIGVNGWDNSVLGSMLSPTATSDSTSTTNINVTQNNSLTENTEITTTAMTAEDWAAVRASHQAYFTQTTTDELKRELAAYL